ncbi:hypothetical protein SK069_11005 [Patulibacter brassicae]|jgi:hypothetical protein|uniref:PH domain-containing protein n=1 Tax=Patulibacter brassicae TaxID=1705717 RepID=A0ABU4VJW8_9ACTN|nr:hypothetical protein [Patulibacter brassicae]MDX8152124.1 hypothetical protein [Patulibacter brassicae]
MTRSSTADPTTAAPPADARVLGHPRRWAIVGWGVPAIVALAGALGLIASGQYGTGAIVLVPFAGFAALCFYVRQLSVVLDGDRLWSRSLTAWQGPVDLRRLQAAGDPPVGRPGRYIHLVDRDGAEVRIDASNLDVAELHRELAARLKPGGSLPTGPLREFVDRQR